MIDCHLISAAVRDGSEDMPQGGEPHPLAVNTCLFHQVQDGNGDRVGDSPAKSRPSPCGDEHQTFGGFPPMLGAIGNHGLDRLPGFGP